MKITYWTAALFTTLVVASLGACGGDDDDSGASTGGSSGSGGTAGSAGTGGTSGSSGSSGTSGSGGTAGSSGSGGTAGAGGTAGTAGSSGSGGTAGSSQTPPTGRVDVETWLAQGIYKQWHCEDAVHAARSPSPHGFNRICSNDLIASNVSGSGEWPEGSAAVKELYASASDTTPVGYAVYLKQAATSAAGANWYWYERVPLTSPAPHDANGVVADGMGDSGPAQTICVGCHAAAGSDAAHTPSTGGRDEVYTPVP
jgi:PPE-repeat protein